VKEGLGWTNIGPPETGASTNVRVPERTESLVSWVDLATKSMVSVSMVPHSMMSFCSGGEVRRVFFVTATAPARIPVWGSR